MYVDTYIHIDVDTCPHVDMNTMKLNNIKMKSHENEKYLSIAILLMMMASPVVFTSCGNDDPMEVESRKQNWTFGQSLTISWVQMWMRSRAIWLNP